MNNEDLFNKSDEEAMADVLNRADQNVFILPQGKTILRVLPTWRNANSTEGPQYIFKEYREHVITTPTRRYFMPSPRPLGGTDPIWDKASELYATKDPVQVEIAKKLTPRRKFLFNVLIIKPAPAEDPPAVGSVRVVKVGPTVWEPIIKLNNDKATEFCHLSNPFDGVNLQIARTGSGITGTRYNVFPAGGRSNVFEDLKSMGVEVDPADIAKSISDLDEFVSTQMKTEKEMIEILNASGLLEGNDPDLQDDPFKEFKEQIPGNTEGFEVLGGAKPPTNVDV